MPKISQRLKEARDWAIVQLYHEKKYTAEEIGKIFSLTTSAIYDILKSNQ